MSKLKKLACTVLALLVVMSCLPLDSFTVSAAGPAAVQRTLKGTLYDYGVELRNGWHTADSNAVTLLNYDLDAQRDAIFGGGSGKAGLNYYQHSGGAYANEYWGIANNTFTNLNSVMKLSARNLFGTTANTTTYAGYTFKRVYQNLDIPFYYDAATNKYTYDSTRNSMTYNNGTLSLGAANGGFWPFGVNSYYFGMYLSVDFVMPKDGRLSNGNAMEFSFSGDDDLWIYISNKLALDLGGVHRAQSGLIDFANGLVYYKYSPENTAAHAGWTNVISAHPRSGYSYAVTFASLGLSLADYSANNMKIFYMERGAGDSNNKMEFNLLTFTGNPNLTKVISGLNSQFVDPDEEFTFRVQTGTSSSNLANYVGDYQITSGSATSTGTMTAADNGRIQLKVGDVLSMNLSSDKYVQMTELDRADKYTGTTYTLTNLETSTVADAVSSLTTAARQIGEDRLLYTYANSVPSGTLQVSKALADGASATTEDFTFTVSFDSTDFSAGNGLYTGDVDVYDTNNLNAASPKRTVTADAVTGEFTLKAGETARISGIPVGTEYTVNEIADADSDYQLSGITVTDNDSITANTVTKDVANAEAVGTIDEASATYTAAFANTDVTGTILLHKKGYKDNGAIETLGGVVFGVYKDYSKASDDAHYADAASYVTTITTNAGGTGKSIALPAGPYYVRELSTAAGYLLDSYVYSVTVTNGNDSNLNAGGHVLGVDIGRGKAGDFINVKETSFTVYKQWSGDENQPGQRPSKVILTVNGIAGSDPTTLITRQVTLTSANAVSGSTGLWSATLEHLPKTDAAGRLYVWSVISETTDSAADAAKLANYAGSYTSHAGNGVIDTALNALRTAGQITVTKYDDSTPAVTLPGAAFQLYKQVESSGWLQQVGDTIVELITGSTTKHYVLINTLSTGSNGQLTFSGLSAGDYYVVETQAPTGYTADTAKHFVTLDSSNMSTAYAVSVTDPRLTSTVTLQKTDGSNLLPGASFTVSRVGTDAQGRETLTPVSLGVTGLTGGQWNGAQWYFSAVYGQTYQITETGAPAGYGSVSSFRVTLDGSGRLVTSGTPNAAVSISNTTVSGALRATVSVADTKLPATVEVTKIWKDSGDSSQRPDSVSVKLQRRVTGGEWADVAGSTVALSASNSWNHTWTVDKYQVTVSGASTSAVLYEYQAVETSVPAGYAVSYAADTAGTADFAFNITNTRTETTSVRVDKTWHDELTAAERSSVTFTLTREVNGVADAAFASANHQLTLSNTDSSVTFSGLEKFDSNGALYTYYVSEAPVTGYATTYSDPNTDSTAGRSVNGTVSVTNTRTGGGDIVVTKNWVDNGNAYGTRPTESEFTITLYRVVGSGTPEIVSTTADVQGTGTAQWTYTYAAQPAYDNAGRAYRYYAEESITNAAKAASYTQDTTRTGAGDLVLYNVLTGTASFDITKVWNDTPDTAARTALSFTVTRTANGVTETVNVQPTMAADDADGRITVDNMPIYNADGYLYTYYVSETPVSGYATAYSNANAAGTAGQVASGSVTVTNTRAETARLKLAKAWVDDGTSHAGYTVRLALYHTSANETESQVAVADLTAAGSWNTILNVQRYDSLGAPYTFRVEEVGIYNGSPDVAANRVDGYLASAPVSSVETDAQGSMTVYTITNTLSAGISAIKTWYDNSNAYSTRPQADATPADLSDNTASTFVLTLHRYTLDAQGARVPDNSFAVTAAAVTGTDTNTWTYDFGNQTEYDGSGSEYHYYVTENAFTGSERYTMGGEFTRSLTNTLTGTVDLAVSKNWADSSNAANVRPASVSVTVYYAGTNNVAAGPYVMTSADTDKDTEGNIVDPDTWTHTFPGLAEFDANGAFLSYEVREVMSDDNNDGFVPYTLTSSTQSTGDGIIASHLVNTIRPTHQIVIRFLDDEGNRLQGDISVTRRYYEGESYDVTGQTAAEFSGYTRTGLDTDYAPDTGRMGNTDLLVVVRYSKTRTIPVTVQYRGVIQKSDGTYDIPNAWTIGIADATAYYAVGDSYSADRDPALTLSYDWVQTDSTRNGVLETLSTDYAAHGTVADGTTGITVTHYFTAKAEPVSQVDHAYNYTYYPYGGTPVTTGEGTASETLNQSTGEVDVNSLLKLSHSGNTYANTGISVTRTKVAQTADELKAAVNAEINARVAAAQSVIDAKADADAKALALSQATAAVAAAQKNYDDALKAYNNALAADSGVAAAQAALDAANAEIVGLSTAEYNAQLQKALDDLNNAKAAATAAEQKLNALTPGTEAYTSASAELDQANVLVTARQTTYDAALAAPHDDSWVSQTTKDADIAAAQLALDNAKAAADLLPAIAALKADAEAKALLLDAAKNAEAQAQHDADLAKQTLKTAEDTEKAKYAAGTAEYDAIVAAVKEDPSALNAQTVTLTGGKFTMDSKYTYRVSLVYLRTFTEEPPVTPPEEPPVTPPTPPTPPVTPPVTIPDEPVPLGPGPRKGSLFTILDEKVPLGALPTTSASRAAKLGGLGALLVLVGTLLCLFKRKDGEN